jgi:hypothetical protein
MKVFEKLYKLENGELINYLKTLLKDRKFLNNMAGAWFLVNKPKLLFIAHRDTVRKPAGMTIFNNYIISPVLDNRLGMNLGINLAKALPFIDILITDGEEMGMSTARFIPKKMLDKYNWIFSIDRMGKYPVTYHHYNRVAYESLINIFGSVAHGTFSDISEINEVFSINFPAGHQSDHQELNYANLDDVEDCYHKIVRFIMENKDIRYRDEHKKFGDFNFYNRWWY